MPKRFCYVIISVILKPGKFTKKKKLVNVYRPIILLLIIGKIVKKVVYNGIANAAKKHYLLFNG